MKKITAYLLLLFPLLSFAQNTYQKGYFIDRDGIKNECLIKNMAWKNSPVTIEYKLNETDEPKIKTIKEITEFSVGDSYKYKKHIVDVDISSSVLNRLSKKKEPQWQKDTLFLKVMVDGKASLYQYEKNNFVKYFFSKDDHYKTEQLVYKQYNKSDNVVAENNQFRQQLFNLMKDGDIEASKFEKIKYKKDDLIALFMNYNKTTNQTVTNHAEKQNKGRLNLKATAGISFSSLNAQNGMIDFGYDFGSKTSFRIGAELEYILPFNNNKWSLFTDPNYQTYSNKGETKEYDWKAEYKYLELPLGVRHYMYLNSESKLFLDAAYVLSYKLGDSYIQYNTTKLDASRASNLALGAGYSYKRYSIEARYNLNHNIINYSKWVTDYNSLSIIFGYSIF